MSEHLIELTHPLFIATACIAIISLIGILTGFILTRSSNKTTKDYFVTDLGLRQLEYIRNMKNCIYESDAGKEIIECIKNSDHHPILIQKEGPSGKVSERDLENFLNDLLEISFVVDSGLISRGVAQRSFSWVLDKVQNSPEIINYVKKVQQLQNGKFYDFIIKGNY